MMTWLLPAIASLLTFGLWGFFTKISMNYLDSKSALIYQTIGVVIIGAYTLNAISYKPITDAKGITYGILTGVAYAIGCWFYFIAASKGKIMTVVTLTALYPFITILLAAVILKESIHLKQWIGVLFSLVAILLMST